MLCVERTLLIAFTSSELRIVIRLRRISGVKRLSAMILTSLPTSRRLAFTRKQLVHVDTYRFVHFRRVSETSRVTGSAIAF
jgi:hypothetical protein